jgi:hypothetical protein
MNLARIPVMKTARNRIAPESPVLTESDIEPMVKDLIPVVERYIEHEWSKMAQSVEPAIGADPKHLHIDFSPLHLSFGDERHGRTVRLDVSGSRSLRPVMVLADRIVEEMRKRLPAGFSLERLPPKSWFDMKDMFDWSMMRLSQDEQKPAER